MAISPVALSAYQNAMASAGRIDSRVSESLAKPGKSGESFLDTLSGSIEKVNALENQKADMVQSFATGETQNVHELMIHLQKAGLAMSLTTAVRGKVMESYRDLVKMQF
ncbi:flagellar hook-basal body complex protein FliE [Desulfolutivibrio sulfoxidireducens]|uniref:flagellar hook-basal body complex protein FliE n=1 Tax=Desulfolutivibrio sulfoxidireducens TaxID=2773299 RepID=UPI00159D0717|nr:flagellar hook-basal body complex protein FliE [Desulfolutivibrio sulfoxidireducens]QLA17504.1 flagellar hook-basal body complex protein FliE [Desulfolutivibrio sulfoxidireducens]QLA21089.1 flagellar hook-basal body complex protein FliE [Desulfolutivibrio sulfoxidireducens]